MLVFYFHHYDDYDYDYFSSGAKEYLIFSFSLVGNQV